MTTTEPAYTPDPADVELVATATEAHHIDFGQTDAMGNNPCVCDRWWDSADEPGWDEHMAEVALSALAAAGRLLPPARVGCPHCGRTSHGFVCQESMKANGQWQGTP